MGLLSFLSKSKSPEIGRLPSGSFTVDPNGRLLTSTLPQSYPNSQALEIGQTVLAVFKSAGQAQIVVNEIHFNYAALKITAREMRGGAIIFLSPRALAKK